MKPVPRLERKGCFRGLCPRYTGDECMKSLEVSAAVVSLTVVLLGGVSCSSTPPPPAPAPTRFAGGGGERGILARCLPNAVANRQAAILGAASLQQQMKLEIQLPLRNQAELNQLLHDLYDPRSPNFHHYLSMSAFTERFSPTAADYRKVAAWAKDKGFNVTATTPNRRLVAVQGTVETVNRAFSVSEQLSASHRRSHLLLSGSRADRTGAGGADSSDHRLEQLLAAAPDVEAWGARLRGRIRPLGRIPAE